MKSYKQMVKAMTNNRLQYMIKTCAEELEFRCNDLELKPYNKEKAEGTRNSIRTGE